MPFDQGEKDLLDEVSVSLTAVASVLKDGEILGDDEIVRKQLIWIQHTLSLSLKSVRCVLRGPCVVVTKEPPEDEI